MRFLAWMGLMMLVCGALGVLLGTLEAFGGLELSAFVSRAIAGVLMVAVIWKAWTGEWIW